MTTRNLLTNSLIIDELSLQSGGLIGMTNAPGRSGIDTSGRVWKRKLANDLDDIENWHPNLLISLIESVEFEQLGISNFVESISTRRLVWRHFPIPNMLAPQETTDGQLCGLRKEARKILSSGGRVLIHCAAGMGRTGTMAALLLIDSTSLTASKAIAEVRTTRPGTIESEAQIAFLMEQSNNTL